MLLTELMDPLRRIAQADLEPFQKKDRLGELSGRTESFALFLLEALQRLTEQKGLRAFGLKVAINVEVVRDQTQMPAIVVRHDVTAIEQGIIKAPIDVGDFYSGCFPFNAVFEGSFVLDRQDPQVQAYFKAVQSEDIEGRRAVLSVLCMRCATAFSISELQLAIPSPNDDLIPFIHEPV